MIGKIPTGHEPSSTTLNGTVLSSSKYLADKLSIEIASPFNLGRPVFFHTILLGFLITAS